MNSIRKYIVAAVALCVLLAMIVIVVRKDNSADQRATGMAPQALTGQPPAARQADPAELTQKLLDAPSVAAVEPADEAYVKSLVSRYAAQHAIQLDDATLAGLVEPVMRMRASIQAAKSNLENEAPLISPEQQDQFIEQLMSGEDSFKQALGITLTDFLDTLSDDEVQRLLAITP